MIKLVNIRPVIPIMALRTPIMGEILNCKMSDGDILQCIHARAFVDEVLEDGTLVRLNLTNYNKDNSHLMKTKINKEEQPVKMEEVPVQPLAEEVVVEPTVEPVVEEPVVEPVIKEVVVEPTVEPVVEEPVVDQPQKENNKKNKKNKK